MSKSGRGWEDDDGDKYTMYDISKNRLLTVSTIMSALDETKDYSGNL